jgi:hypothetical protein
MRKAERKIEHKRDDQKPKITRSDHKLEVTGTDSFLEHLEETSSALEFSSVRLAVDPLPLEQYEDAFLAFFSLFLVKYLGLNSRLRTY